MTRYRIEFILYDISVRSISKTDSDLLLYFFTQIKVQNISDMEVILQLTFTEIPISNKLPPT